MIDNLITLDTDGDGISDAIAYWDENGLNYAYDTNLDGVWDMIETYSGFDEYGNPHHFEVQCDTDANGIMDRFVAADTDYYNNTVAYSEAYDYDQDGNFDMVKEFADTTGDGTFDTVTTARFDNTGSSETMAKVDSYVDYDGDRQKDAGFHSQILDYDGDGNPDSVRFTSTDPEGNIVEETEMPFEDYLAINEMDYSTSLLAQEPLDLGQFDPDTDASMVSGDPAEDMELWEYQGNTGRCAIYAQKFAIEAITGREISIEELVAVAEENGWFVDSPDGGTTSLNMNKLLEYYGVEHEMSFGNEMSEIEDALNDGNKVIVGVDSGQIWFGDENDIFSPETTADHAVEVIGIDRSDPANPMVVLNDSGSPDGCGELVPLDVFENAWNAGDSQMIVCYA